MMMIAIVPLLLCSLSVASAGVVEGGEKQVIEIAGSMLIYGFCINEILPPSEVYYVDLSTCPDWSLTQFTCYTDNITYLCRCTLPSRRWDGRWDNTMFKCEAIVPTIGDSCSDAVPCVGTGAECIEALCLCGPLYRYNETINNCQQVCTTVTDDFWETTPKYIYRNNHLPTYLNITTYEECQRFCVWDDECLSFELRNNNCFRSRYTLDMLDDVGSDLVQSDERVRHGSRMCA